MNLILKKIIVAAGGRIRFLMAVLGLSIALLLILSAVQLQSNFNALLYSKNNQDSIANFLVVNKVLNNETYGATALSDNDIKDLKQQSFIDEIGILSPSRFKASIQSNSERFPFYTEIAFESVPSNFLDVTNKEWTWKDSTELLPIIAPAMFLDFYNFQFSFSQNMPQLTQDVVKMIVFKVSIQTPFGPINCRGRIVGFSDRITSLLVPQEFMDWANRSYGNNRASQPSRVIIKTKDPGNPVLVEYLKNKGYFVDADKTRFSKYRKVVNTVAGIGWVTGMLMFVFALLIFTLFIQLTVSSCKSEIELLITLGASPKQLTGFLMKQFFPSNVIIVLASLLIVASGQYYCYHFLSKQNMAVSPFISLYTLMVAAVVLLLLWFVTRTSVRKYVMGK